MRVYKNKRYSSFQQQHNNNQPKTNNYQTTTTNFYFYFYCGLLLQLRTSTSIANFNLNYQLPTTNYQLHNTHLLQVLQPIGTACLHHQNFNFDFYCDYNYNNCYCYCYCYHHPTPEEARRLMRCKD
jgi:hypothetical protein